MPIPELIIRLFATILVLLIMALLNGPKQISQMNFYDYIVGITIGSIAANTTIDSDLNPVNGLLAIVLFLLCGFCMSWLARHSLVLRRFLSGRPIVLIAKGVIQWHGLERARMNTNELLSNLRYSGYFNIADIDYAVLEPTGKLSVQPKGAARPPKTSELNLIVSESSLFANVLVDGRILHGNLKAFGKDEQWLLEELMKQGVRNRKDVGLATLNAQGDVSVYLKDRRLTDRSSLI